MPAAHDGRGILDAMQEMMGQMEHRITTQIQQINDRLNRMETRVAASDVLVLLWSLLLQLLKKSRGHNNIARVAKQNSLFSREYYYTSPQFTEPTNSGEGEGGEREREEREEEGRERERGMREAEGMEK
jgi:hypothetical protein